MSRETIRILVAVILLITIIINIYFVITKKNKKEQFQNTYTEEQLNKARELLSNKNITFTEFKFNMPDMDVVDFVNLKSL